MADRKGHRGSSERPGSRPPRSAGPASGPRRSGDQHRDQHRSRDQHGPAQRAPKGGQAEKRSPDRYPAEGRHAGAAPSRHRPRAGRAPFWIYGVHAVSAALANPERRIREILATTEMIERDGLWSGSPMLVEVTRVEIERRLPPGAVHQGLAARVEPLPEVDLTDVCRAVADRPRAVVVVLDMVSDPQNVGAVLRSAAAFDAAAVIVPEHGAPDAGGALAKAASGALESIPLVRATNLRRALDTLKEAGFWCVGLAGDAEAVLGRTPLPDRAVLVFGAEGAGLRRLTREACDLLVRIPIGAAMESLNVSAATAVTLFDWARTGAAEDA
jgi:23S rRNA (guanosine2251-2'-O)-methyltransferase